MPNQGSKVTMANANFVIRTMTPGDLDTVIEWAAAEGWNPGQWDRDAFLAADPEGFLVGLLDGRPIASISVVKYGSSFGFLGLYIVQPEYRGQGYGIAIWRAGMARMRGRSVGLDGVVAQQANYAKSGFAPAYSHFRFCGRGGAPAADDARILPLSGIAFDALCQYDRTVFPETRNAFLSAWIARPGSTALGLVEHGGLRGYGVIRPSRDGFRVGPLFADTPAIGERLLQALMARVPADAAVFLDVPLINAAAMALVQGLGMTPDFETARMYAGTDPKLPVERIFAVTSLELG
jgi:ribosomal protein S18 acetylase RimI-like enzyme